MMDPDAVKGLCAGLGDVERFEERTDIFGNIRLEIVTHKRTRIYITSDRGEFSCYAKRRWHLKREMIPLSHIKIAADEGNYKGLADVISFLKANIQAIEKQF